MVPLLMISLAGCSATQSDFARTAGNAGSALAAAAATLNDAHQGAITMAYAASSFVNFRSELDGIASQLASSSGGPGRRATAHLVALFKRAWPAIAHPCLEDGCDWHAQVAAIQRASDALVRTGGG
jgi:uncharacterized protein YceK